MIEQTVIHVHIPKAAGSTIDSILNPCFREEERFHCGVNFTGLSQFESNIYFSRMEDDRKRRFRYISGHVEYFLLQSFPARHFSFTLLRNPLDRIVSMYYYIRQSETHHLHRTLLDGGLSLVDFVEGGLWHEIDNGMCRRLSGVCDRIPYGECGEDVLKLAKFNLANNLSFVGLQERFDESLFLLLYHLQALERLEYSRVNVTRSRRKVQEIGGAERAAILRRNALDVELYAFARDLYTVRNRPAVEKLRKPMQRFLAAMSLKNN